MTRLRHELAEADLSQLAHAIIEDLGIESVETLREFTFDELEQNLLDTVDNLKADRSEDDVLYELLLKYGLDLALKVEERSISDKRVFVLGAGALVVCLAADVSLEVVEGIGALKGELKPEVRMPTYDHLDEGQIADMAAYLKGLK